MVAPPLPHDVWLNIAHFIPVLALRTLLDVNSSLFHIALDARYRQISFIYWDDRILRNLIRLKDPYIARRVKILHIYPGFLKELLERDDHPSIQSTPSRDKPASFRERLADITRVFNPPRVGTNPDPTPPPNLYDLPPRQSIERLRERLRTAQDVMSAMLDLLRSLPALTDYYVTWYGLPSADPFHSSLDLQDSSLGLSLTNIAVPVIATPLLSSSLTKLSLDISLENIHALCSASFHLARLEQLDLHLHADHPLPLTHLYTILYSRLARALAPLSPFLRSLSIEAHEPMDIGPLFKGLNLFTRLETLSLALPVQKPHLGNPKSLGSFLRRQSSTIKCLRIRATQHDSAGSSSVHQSWRRAGTPDPWSLNSWIRTALGSEHGEEYSEWYSDYDDIEEIEQEDLLGEYDMDALETLEVSSNLVPLETALYLAERFGRRIKSLGLLGSVKSFEFVKELLRVLARKPSISDTDDSEPSWQWLTPSSSSPSTTPPPDTQLAANTNLQTLKIGPVPLSPELIDLLAHNLSNLRHLELIVKHFLPSQEDVPIFGVSGRRGGGAASATGGGAGGGGGGGGSGEGVQLDDQVYEFLETMQNEWIWAWWGLKTISVYTESSLLSMPLMFSLSSPPPPPATTTTTSSPTPKPRTSSKGPMLSSTTTTLGKTVDSVATVTAATRMASTASTCAVVAAPSLGPSTSVSSCSSASPPPSSSSYSLVSGSTCSQSHMTHESEPFSLSHSPVLPLLQLPSLSSSPGTKNTFVSVSVSTPASPSSTSSPATSIPTPTFSHPFASASNGNVNTDVFGGGRSSSLMARRTPILGSASTSALPISISGSSSSGSGGLNLNSGRTGSSSWRGDARATRAYGSCSGVSSSTPTNSTSVVDGVGEQEGMAGPTSFPGKNGHHHMFSFLKHRPRSKSRKEKEKGKGRERATSVSSPSTSNGTSTPPAAGQAHSPNSPGHINSIFGMSLRGGGGAIASAHAGLLPMNGASASVAAAFGAPASSHIGGGTGKRKDKALPSLPLLSPTTTTTISTPHTPRTPTSATSTSTVSPLSSSPYQIPITSPVIPFYRVWISIPSNQSFIRLKEHNRAWIRDGLKKSTNHTTNSNQQRGREKSKRVLEERDREREVEREKARVSECKRIREMELREREHEREKERERRHHHPTGGNGRRRQRRRTTVDPLSSFGSVSSEVSGVSSTVSGLSGDGKRTSSVGGGEEKITLEVALAEVLARCLPGVRVVR